MLEKKKICIVTASRAEYGLLRPIIQKFHKRKDFDIRVVATGMHLSPEFGLTFREIEEDGISIDRKIEMLLSADTPSAITISMGVAMIGFANYFAESKPDLLMLLGDRYEILAVATAAMNARIPIAHLYGGDVTEGAIDDVVRHAITKLSHLHFVSTSTHRTRVIQMGENPDRVFCVGAMSVESAKSAKLLDRVELERQLDFSFGSSRIAVVTFHPATLEEGSAGSQCSELLKALDQVPNLKMVFTKANADAEGRVINHLIDEYVSAHQKKSCVFASLGQSRYLSTVSIADVVVGNSSSGLSEVPSFHVPTVNIGDRQKGRERSSSVIDCNPKKTDILKALNRALSDDFKKIAESTSNPYEKEGTSEQIVDIISMFLSKNEITVVKKFYDL